MPNAVLIIDMVRGFMEPGHNLYCGDESRAVIPKVRDVAERELSHGSKLLFLCDNHAPDDLEFRIFPPHRIRGTHETEVIQELRDLPGEIIPKTRYSAFHNTTLDDHLLHIGPQRLIITGVCTDICVLYTAEDARNRDFDVDVPIECVTSFDPQGHGFALDHMRRILGVHVLGDNGSC
ncbi:MAG TPA: isochorismatase family cysteine hydrolase [Dehalococcoidia bacterium]|nr:isochorismatase family cysteine hydrolase [Dehalococcoidia bacterium]